MTGKQFFYTTFGCMLFGVVLCYAAMREYVPQRVRSGHIYFCEDKCGGQFYEFSKSKHTIECVCWDGTRVKDAWRKDSPDPIIKGTPENRFLYPKAK